MKIRILFFILLFVMVLLSCKDNGNISNQCTCPNGTVHTDASCACSGNNCNCTYEPENVGTQCTCPNGMVHTDAPCVCSGNNCNCTYEPENGSERPITFSVATTIEWVSATDAIRNGGSDKVYIINVTDNFDVMGSTQYTFGSVRNINVTINGRHTLFLNGNGNLIRTFIDQTVYINEINLKGNDINNSQIVYILSNSTFIMQGNSFIYGNTNDSNSSSGGGVYNLGTFIMQDNASIHNNLSNGNGGGVSNIGGTFIMQDNASVHNNLTNGNGGGVYNLGGTFIMQDNTSVYNNSVNGSGNLSNGGGVVIQSAGLQVSTFTMNGNATVNNNTVSGSTNNMGGGVMVGGNLSTFIMQDNTSVHSNNINGSGSISGTNGGGVYISVGTLIMEDNASVFNNNSLNNAINVLSQNYGGGISNIGGKIYMKGYSSIYGNILGGSNGNRSGGGIMIAGGASAFYIEGGIIYGNNDVDVFLRNIAITGSSIFSLGGGIVQYGVFIDDEWNSSGNIGTSSNTINVINGVLQ